MEIQRKITEAIKRLLGYEILHLWEGTPMVALIPDIDTAIDRIAYFYANPSQANLEDSIERYPGLTSWNEFELSLSNPNAKCSTSATWIRARSLEKLPSPGLSRFQDIFFFEKFINSNKKSHELIVEPNAWMKCFNINNTSEVIAINQSIVSNIIFREQKSRERRALKGEKVLGAHKLVLEPIMKPHKPKKKNKKIFVICLDKNLRLSLIKDHQKFCALRRERYEEWKIGDFSSPWPPGAFRPPMPPLSNLLEFKQSTFF